MRQCTACDTAPHAHAPSVHAPHHVSMHLVCPCTTPGDQAPRGSDAILAPGQCERVGLKRQKNDSQLPGIFAGKNPQMVDLKNSPFQQRYFVQMPAYLLVYMYNSVTSSVIKNRGWVGYIGAPFQDTSRLVQAYCLIHIQYILDTYVNRY